MQRWMKFGWQMTAAAVLLGAAVAAARADQFQKPTKEELEMTSLPGYPGAAAVVLYREEITRDDLHVVQHYERIKILTEDGKKYANVELGFFSTQDIGDMLGDDKTIGDIVGRTIHVDGTVIPFTGKPYLKVIEKATAHDDIDKLDIKYKMQAKVFTLPDVEVGSIIEYRYSTRISDNFVESPDWYVQGDLYVKAAHYQWFPTLRDLVDTESQAPINSITWFPILPASAKVEHTETPSGSLSSSGRNQIVYNLSVKDIPPVLHEEYMPPIASYSYRVLFNFSQYHSQAEYWASEGKRWSKRKNSFVDPNSQLRDATQAVIAGATTQDEKLRKIYAAIMSMENTHFTREHEAREDKINTAADVVNHKRGTPEQLTEAFVGMARAAGMKAYLMLVPDRAEELFAPGWMSFRQFDDTIAIVNVDGKEEFFDPGERYCAYGHLAWQHTFVNGLRQTDSGSDLAKTPGDGFAANKTTRVANLNMDDHGQITGKIDLTFLGSPALRWRQAGARGDEESLKHGLRTHLEEMLPKSLDVKVTNIQNLDDYDKPLVVTYTVKGTVGTPTGKRVLLPADLFMTGEHAVFPHEKRENAVYFHYPQMVQDALRLNLPQNMAVEAVPDPAKVMMKKEAAYDMTVTSTPNNFTTRRNFIFGDIVVPTTDYADLRAFYSQFETKDQESVVLKPVEGAAPSTAAPGAN